MYCMCVHIVVKIFCGVDLSVLGLGLARCLVLVLFWSVLLIFQHNDSFLSTVLHADIRARDVWGRFGARVRSAACSGPYVSLRLCSRAAEPAWEGVGSELFEFWPGLARV